MLEALLKEHLPGVDVWAYGSRVNGRSHDGSDLDLVLRGPGLKEIPSRELEDFQEAVRESNIPFLVDGCDWARLPERVQREIERNYVPLVAKKERGMPTSWQKVTIDDVAVILDGPHATPRKTESGPVFLGISSLSSGRLDLTSADYLSEEDYLRWTKRVTPQDGDVVFSYETRLGEAAMIPEGLRCCLGRRMGLLRARRERIHPRFLLYAYLGPSFQETLRSRVVYGSTVERILLTELGRLPIKIPRDLGEQDAIAHILGTLDDKIELNRRMNETLEGMARALFKSWFVDFDPVRAKIEGRDTGLPKHIADLFPDRMVDSELGEIPEGWAVIPLADCVEVMRGLSYKGSGLSSDGVPMHNLNSMYEGGGYKHEGLKGYAGEYNSQHVARAGDLIVANTEQGHERLLIGYAAIVPTSFVNDTLFSHHIYRVRPVAGMALTTNFLCQLLNTEGMHEIVSGFANGTTINMLPMDALQIPQIMLPTRPLLATFNDLADVARRRHEELIDESRTLAALRDAILPRLISDDFRVDHAEKVIGRIV